MIHNGNYVLARKLIIAAKDAGADYVKFQTARPERVISRYAPKAEYQLGTTKKEESQLDMCRAIHLPLTDYKPLKDFCDEIGIKFLSTLLEDSVWRNYQFTIFAKNCTFGTSSNYVNRNVRLGRHRGSTQCVDERGVGFGADYSFAL